MLKEMIEYLKSHWNYISKYDAIMKLKDLYSYKENWLKYAILAYKIVFEQGE